MDYRGSGRWLYVTVSVIATRFRGFCEQGCAYFTFSMLLNWHNKLTRQLVNMMRVENFRLNTLTTFSGRQNTR